MSFSLYFIQAATLYLGDFGQIMSLEFFSSAEKKEILSDEQFCQIGELFRETLVQCRHKVSSLLSISFMVDPCQ